MVHRPKELFGGFLLDAFVGVEAAQFALKQQITPGPQEFVHQVKGRGEEDAVPSLNQLVPHGGGEVGLAHPGQSKDQQVFGAVNKFAAAELSQLAGEAQGQFLLVESCQGFACGQMGGFLQALDTALAAPLDFLFKQFGEEGFERPGFAGGAG